MKNLLILIVFAAVFLHFYPQPEVTDWYNEQKEAALKIFSDATDTSVSLKADKIYKDLEPKFGSFRESEIKRLKEITSSKDNVKAFYTDFCSNKRDRKFHVDNQKLVCQTISRYTKYF